MAFRKAVDFSGLSDTDWARLAAFIDGEGNIRIHGQYHIVKKGRYKNDFVVVTISNTDPRLMDWLVHRFGGSVNVGRRQRSFHRLPYHWVVAAAQAKDVLIRALPYFVIKREQADIALAFSATVKRWGVKGMPQYIRDEREVLKARLSALTARPKQGDQIAAG